MSAEANALADALETPTYCLGCGHDSRIKSGLPCCPEANYVSVRELISICNRLTNRNVELTSRHVELRRELTKLQLKLNPPETSRIDGSYGPWTKKPPKWKGPV